MIQRSLSLFTGAAGVFVVSGFASAQSFVNVSGALGGPSYSTKCEGVEVADLDLDGKLDIVASTGFVLSPGSMSPHIPQIQMNKSTGAGSFTFTDEALTRLPAGFAVQAGGCSAFDVDGDGDADLVFAQMGTGSGRQPLLLRNNGAGVFTDITTTNFPVVLMISPCAQFGDIDNDGDLDVALCDQGKPIRMFRNDGTGMFTDITTTNMPSINITNAQDVSLVDIDNDFDLDIISTAKTTTGQKMYLNNGAGVFTDASSIFAYNGSGNNYESEWADLDNDGDVDGFWVSIASLNEGTTLNTLIESGGTLGFNHNTASSNVSGGNGDDDNEITFIDFNNDGRLDVIVGSLGSAEKLYLTAPGFTFVKQVSAFTVTSDPTLDGAAGDFDNDGKMDYVTAVGESGTGNKLFKNNTGPVDTQAPKILRTQSLANYQLGSGPFIFRNMIQDGSYDDGQDYITAKFDVSVEANNGTFNASNVAMKRMGGHLFRGSIDVAGMGASVPGALVTYTPKANDRVGNAVTGPPKVFQVAGYLNYGVGSPGNALSLTGVGVLQSGAVATWTTTGCYASQVGGILWSEGRGSAFNLFGFGETFLLDIPSLGEGALGSSDGSGVMTIMITVPSDPTLIGRRFDLQSLCLTPFSTANFSNGIEATIIP
ncbi:MAG: VCBS repeat-containing protein [Planctomycetes bacterium]|nr:VCBS repeat-containing protein [Planctomycetota bacterium]